MLATRPQIGSRSSSLLGPRVNLGGSLEPVWTVLCLDGTERAFLETDLRLGKSADMRGKVSKVECRQDCMGVS